ncbi:MAG: sugar porter family MFS transporter [Pirellulales bacterium]|nr:sugar porter family MFS transporter [Pirellulales bacterium]
MIKLGGMGYLAFICLVTTIGGFLFGFDTVVISGGEKLFQAQFGLSDDQLGWVAASAILGCILGSAVSGTWADRFGRKPVLVLCALLLFVSALGSMLAQTSDQLVVARLIGGIGVGITAMASPMYMSETSPARYRGGIVALYQLAITLGIVVAFVTNAILANYALDHAGTQGSGFWHSILIAEVWRGMFGVEILPALCYLLALGFIPESPRWLIQRGQVDTARRVLRRIQNAVEAEQSITDVRETLAHDSGTLADLFRPGLRKALALGVALALFSQFSGINAVMYYGPRLLGEVGFQATGAMNGAVLIGIINFLFTFLAIWKVDTFGRRSLLLAGVSGAFLSLLAAAILFRIEEVPNLAKLAPLVIYCACFSFSYGPVCWIVIGEIFPTAVRGRAVAIATTAIWIGAFTLTRVFPPLLKAIGAGNVFGIFAIITGFAVVFIWQTLPETKGRTLEEIERSWGGSKNA